MGVLKRLTLTCSKSFDRSTHYTLYDVSASMNVPHRQC